MTNAEQKELDRFVERAQWKVVGTKLIPDDLTAEEWKRYDELAAQWNKEWAEAHRTLYPQFT